MGDFLANLYADNAPREAGHEADPPDTITAADSDASRDGVPNERQREPALRGAPQPLLFDLDTAPVPEADELQGEPLGPDGWPCDAIEPGEPCPRCGSLEKWWDLHGGEHCQHCEAEKLKQALSLADRAAELRRQAPFRENRAPQPAPVASEPAGPTQNTLGTSGDSRGSYRLSRGCKNG